MILHHAAQLLHYGLLLDCSDIFVGSSHDSNEHVHENHLDNDSSYEEEDPHSLFVHGRVVVLVEVTESSQVSMNDSIEELNTSEGVKDWLNVTTCTIVLEHNDDTREGKEDH